MVIFNKKLHDLSLWTKFSMYNCYSEFRKLANRASVLAEHQGTSPGTLKPKTMYNVPLLCWRGRED